jgi:hypothetical protein
MRLAFREKITQFTVIVNGKDNNNTICEMFSRVSATPKIAGKAGRRQIGCDPRYDLAPHAAGFGDREGPGAAASQARATVGVNPTCRIGLFAAEDRSNCLAVGSEG